MTAKKPTWSQLRRTLTELEKPELLDLIQQLYKLNADNKVFLTSRLTSLDPSELAEPYRQIIRAQLNPARGEPTLSLRTARKAVTDFCKACDDPAAVVDLMLFYVEQGVACTNRYGDLYESFYASMESMYESALELLHESGDPALPDHFRDRAYQIVRDTSGSGWGFHDQLRELYDSYLGG